VFFYIFANKSANIVIYVGLSAKHRHFLGYFYKLFGGVQKITYLCSPKHRGLLEIPPLTKQENGKKKRTENQCAVYALQHTVLRLPDYGKRT
jgi:hypothetical protein